MKLQKSSLALVLVAVVAAAGALGARPGPAQAATASDACPLQDVPATAFTDTVGSLHRSAIDCAAWWGLTGGETATTFGAHGSISRGQTTAMVARLLRNSGVAPTDVPPAGFSDTVGHRFAADIDLLVHLDIVSGVTPERFEPEAPIRRSQMATIITAMFAGGYEAPLPAGEEAFDDVEEGGVHREAIASLSAAGITTGVAPKVFAPSRAVKRAEMASFLTRSAERLVDAGLATAPSARPAADDPFGSKTRGAWVHLFEDTLKSRIGIVRMLDELVAAGGNTVVAQVIRRHDAYYFSDVLPRTPDPKLHPSFDVLATLLEEAHARGVEVHAWYSVAPTWHGTYDGLPQPEGWISAEHGKRAPEEDRWVTRRTTPDGYQWSDYLDLGLPEVQDHIAAVVGELATKYDIDGIHLDYTRYESPNHGYHPRAIQRYYEDVGHRRWPSADDPEWSNWRRARTREVVLRAGQAIAASGRDVDLSAAVISWGSGPPTPDRAGFQRSAPYRKVLQDWDQWVRQGDVDMVMPMNYFNEDDPSHARWFAEWLAYEARLTADVGARIVPGPAAYMNRPAGTLSQVSRAMQRTNGAMLYSFHQVASDFSRSSLSQLAAIRWGYSPARG